MLSIYSYTLPFNSPFTTASNTYTHRKGLILLFRDGDIEAYGDVAPLPGFSSESLDEVIAFLKLNRKAISDSIHKHTLGDLHNIFQSLHRIPSLIFGLDTLMHDLRAKRSGVPFSQTLGNKPGTKIEVNGVLGFSSTEKNLKTARHLYKNGYRTLKLKVGLHSQKEEALIRSLRSEFPDLNIRIDANQSWSVQQAIRELNVLSKYQIEYCEQPIKADDLEGMHQIRKETGVRIAADESLRNKSDAIRLSEASAADIFILKPMLFGSFEDIRVTIEYAKSHNIDIVITTSLESIVGRTSTANIAAQWGSNTFAHGLSTGSMLKTDLGERPNTAGILELGDMPGLGITLLKEQLRDIL